MTKLIVDGPARLSGRVKISGSKNAVLPILAASIMATKPIELSSVPDIRDVRVMLEVLGHFGIQSRWSGDHLMLDPSRAKAATVPDELAQSLRASVLVMGSALARFGRIKLAHPGGDLIGKRPLDIHFKGLECLGVRIAHSNDHYSATAKHLKGVPIFLEEPSVTATENVIMAAALADGETTIHNAASELHVKDLAAFLNGLGASIEGAGTNLVRVRGVDQLDGASHRVRGDEIEAATFVIAAAVTGGKLRITGVDPEHFGMILIKLREAGVNFRTTKTEIAVSGPHRLRGTKLKVETWPGFPTDLQPPFTVLMTQAKGMSLVHDHMYENRFIYTDKLIGMGANITVADPHRIIISGPTKLSGMELESPDIRAGITLLVAALLANGRTTLDHAEIIDRGYERIDKKLRKLGAKIRRVDPAP